MTIQFAIADLTLALVETDLDAPEPPESADVLEEVQSALTPFHLPTDLVELWTRVDVDRLAAQSNPRLHGPESALRSWRAMLDDMGEYWPAQMLPIGYTSRYYLLSELGEGARDGGALFLGGIVDGTFAFAGSLESWLAAMVATLRSGEFAVHRYSDGTKYATLFAPDPTPGEVGTPPGTLAAAWSMDDRGRWAPHWRAAGGE